MDISEKMRVALDQAFNWELINVPKLDEPILIVMEYSPSNYEPPLSIAFDFSGGPKCWMTVPTVREIGKIAPSRHDPYREFSFRNYKFYPYSIQKFPKTIFQDIQQFTSACLCLYRHAEWKGGNHEHR